MESSETSFSLGSSRAKQVSDLENKPADIAWNLWNRLRKKAGGGQQNTQEQKQEARAETPNDSPEQEEVNLEDQTRTPTDRLCDLCQNINIEALISSTGNEYMRTFEDLQRPWHEYCRLCHNFFGMVPGR